MNIELKHIKDKNSNSERVVLIVKKDCNVGSYLVFLAKKTGVNAFGIASLEYPFWFPDKEVKENDLIILYTKKGNSSQKVNEDKTTSYFFYRGMDTPIFKKDDNIALLVQADSWSGI